MLNIDVRKLSFMAILTTVLLICVQGASLVSLYQQTLKIDQYLAVWTPLLTLAVGYWFGKSGTAP